jgi:hypothetical protein
LWLKNSAEGFSESLFLGGSDFGFDRNFFTLDVSLAAFAFGCFIRLLTHKCLYFVYVLRFCGAQYEMLRPTIQSLSAINGVGGNALRLPEREKGQGTHRRPAHSC